MYGTKQQSYSNTTRLASINIRYQNTLKKHCRNKYTSVRRFIVRKSLQSLYITGINLLNISSFLITKPAITPSQNATYTRRYTVAVTAESPISTEKNKPLHIITFSKRIDLTTHTLTLSIFKLYSVP